MGKVLRITKDTSLQKLLRHSKVIMLYYMHSSYLNISNPSEGGAPGGMPGAGGPGGFPGGAGGPGATHDDGPTVEEVD
ncbi:hypothetical protein V498_01602 [Pseudogymnoascus sp. VKM F-4517 (FW-2822)]|nr:hypothetical protein V498_01602 [Pseudogymnoascus sp. VKM F-4517 (FW-2822)]